MTPSSGAISFGNVQTEFGGSNPISLSEYYAGGGRVQTGTYNVPTSGTISMSQMRNKGKASASSWTSGGGTSGSGIIIYGYVGNFSPDPSGRTFNVWYSFDGTTYVDLGVAVTVPANADQSNGGVGVILYQNPAPANTTFQATIYTQYRSTGYDTLQANTITNVWI